MLPDRYESGQDKAMRNMKDPGKQPTWRRIVGSRYTKVFLISLPILVLAVLGILHVVLVASSHISFSGDQAWKWDSTPDRSQSSGSIDGDTAHVLPIPCHSHNDYQRHTPLFDALRAGCTSIEADIWLIEGSDELRVGHGKPSSSAHTLEDLYLEPIAALLDRRNQNVSSESTINGLFELATNQTTVLLLDSKSNPINLLAQVHKAIDPLRQKNRLSFWNGKEIVSRPITIVLTGKALHLPPSALNANDIFFEAPLARLDQQPERWNTSNAYYASTSFKSSIGDVRMGRLSSHQLAKLRSQIEVAKNQGLKVRYWETPSWPTSLRNYIWQLLLEEGVDVLNVDDLQAAAFLDWRNVEHQWFDA